MTQFLKSSQWKALLGVGVISLLSVGGAFALDDGWKSGIKWAKPPVVTPGENGGPPSDAVVLFDGTNLDAWNGVENWKIQDGYAIAGSFITTKQEFGDVQLHLEFATPTEIRGEGQGRGNNGVFFLGQYEVQILDSYENETYYDGQAASIYKQSPPSVNASRKPGEWQTYDIIFTAPEFAEDGSVTKQATMTVLHNGVVVQNHFKLLGSTHWHKGPEYVKHPTRGPISLYYHNDPIRFRNIWVRDLKPAAVEE